MEEPNRSCLAKAKFVTGGGAKPAGLKRRLGIGQDAVLGPRPRRRFTIAQRAIAPRAGFVVRAGRRHVAV